MTELPLFPETYKALMEFRGGLPAIGLVFSVQGKLFEYRQIQAAYNTAFRRAGLPYSSTHVMRHGGCSAVYNLTGDLTIAQQHLGNKSLETAKVYAHRNSKALTEVAKEIWKNTAEENGRAKIHQLTAGSSLRTPSACKRDENEYSEFPNFHLIKK